MIMIGVVVLITWNLGLTKARIDGSILYQSKVHSNLVDNFLNHMIEKENGATKLLCDNKSIITMVKNYVFWLDILK